MIGWDVSQEPEFDDEVNLRRHWRSLPWFAAWRATIRCTFGAWALQGAEALLRPHISPQTFGALDVTLDELARDFDVAREGLKESRDLAEDRFQSFVKRLGW